MIHAIIFDLDGTLVDTEMLWVRGLEEYLCDSGYPITHELGVELVFGRAWRDIYADLCTRFPELDIPIERMADGLQVRFEQKKEGVDIRIHDSIAKLHELSERYPVCIVSGSSRREIKNAIEIMGIHARIRFFLGTEDYAPGKPHPNCFLTAAAKLGVSPDQCLVFEDSAAGVKAAKAADMRCVGLQRPGLPHQDLSGADLVLDSLARFQIDAL